MNKRLFHGIARWVVVLTISFVQAAPAAAQAKPWEAGPFAGEPKEILAAAASIAPDKYPYATVLLDETRYTIDEARRITRTHRYIYRIDSPKAIDGWDRTSVYWEPWHQERPVLKARVITADGKVFWLDPATLSDAPARQESGNVYTDTRYLGGPIPGVAVGAIVEEFNERKDTSPLFAAGTVQRYVVGSRMVTAETRVVVDYPASLPVKVKVLNLPQLVQRREEAGGRIRLTFEQGYLEAFPATPDLLPPDAFLRGYIEFTTASSWKDVNESYFRSVDGKVRTADVAALVKETVQRGDPRDLVLRKLVARLHRDVRYTGIEFGEAAIIPQFPAETLRRRFGDCKDKSTLLVAMLRSAGIPAFLALVNTDSPEIDPDLPGLGLFNHAIVYVPGPPEQWIDATAEYETVGAIPASIRGKLALVIDGAGDHPLRIPEAKSSDNVLAETRDFYLPAYGPARVVETGQATGFIDEGYRAYFSGPDSKDRRDSLERYAKSVYLSDSFTGLKMGDGRDLLTPFTLEMSFPIARRGVTDLDEAVVAIRAEGLFSRLPGWFTTPPEDKTRKNGGADEPEPPRTADYYFQPHQVEWRYRIHPPLGFRLRALPGNSTRDFGPARLTQEWSQAADGTVEGVLRFDTVKGRYSVAEAEAARDAIVEAMKAPAVVAGFDNIGAASIAIGKVREGLAEYRRVEKLEPKEAMHRVRISRALLQAGLGEQARREAEAAVSLDPKSEPAYLNLGWVLEHDLLGRRFEPGFDRDGAIAAYRKAMELDPKDFTPRASAGIVEEYNTAGEHYGQGALLSQAIDDYQALKDIDKEQYDRFEINQVFCALYAGKFSRVLEQIGSRAAEDRFASIVIATTAASDGSEAALLRSARLIASQQTRSEALQSASSLLLRLRRYPEAADLLAVAAQGAENASALLDQVEIFRRAKRSDAVAPPATDPALAVHKLFVALGSNTSPEVVSSILSRSSRMAGKAKGRDDRRLYMRSRLMGALGDTGLPEATVLDLILSNTEYSSEGDDQTGYRVWVRLPQTDPQAVFVVREDGEFRVLGYLYVDPLGWEALAKLKAGNPKAAAKLLDWARELFDIGDADDPAGGRLFARLWEKNPSSPPNANLIEAAAIALILPATDKDFTADVERAAASLPDSRATERDRLLWMAYSNANQWEKAEEVSARLYKAYPKSQAAFAIQAGSLLALKRYRDAEALARERLAADGDDEAAIEMLSQALIAQDRVAEARDFLRARIKSGKAKAGDLNNFAWNALLTGVDDEALDAARRAAATSPNSYPILHTLACLYAEVGRTIEARELMLKAMRANDLDKLDSSLWYVYGRIAEQYGEDEAARSAYARVDKPEQPEVMQSSTWYFASRRLAAIDQRAKAAPGTHTGR